ncbi:hypothetical protein [Acidithrix ferrooxidans]|uniref:hypothetical protein n=1 Tax=Acidithrix ferrooxidans TaxID=1280514 RepID=UPI001364CF31|nr:hypothetical protein [Acidithrix ferrooxidans]
MTFQRPPRIVLRPLSIESTTPGSRASAGILSRLERVLTLNPSHEGEALEDLEI